MRTGLDKQSRKETRDLIERCERELPVTAVEKLLFRLGYLAELMFQSEETKSQLRSLAGSTEMFRALPSEAQAGLAKLAPTFGIPTGRVLFWMWRAWLMETAFVEAATRENATVDPRPMAGSDHLGEPRSMSEELWLDPGYAEIMAAARARVGTLRLKLQEVSETLDRSVAKADYALSGSTGSPLAALQAAKRLLESEAARLEDAANSVREAYGFTAHQKPNLKLDKHSLRNLELFFHWHKSSYQECLTRHGLTKNQADKIAFRLKSDLERYDQELGYLEEDGDIPTLAFAKILRPSRTQ